MAISSARDFPIRIMLHIWRDWSIRRFTYDNNDETSGLASPSICSSGLYDHTLVYDTGRCEYLFHEAFQALTHTGQGMEEQILWNIRFPRIAAGAFVGANLAVSGAILQVIMKTLWLIPTLSAFHPVPVLQVFSFYCSCRK